jgi:hypothetical protein
MGVRRAAPPLAIEFAGERYEVPRGRAFTIGRAGDLVIDDNPYLHRRFLALREDDGIWWLENIGGRLAATITDAHGRFSGRLAPGARLAVAYDRLHVLFAAGPTTYDLELVPGFTFPASDLPQLPDGEDTVGTVPFTPAQRLLILALSEPVLRRTESGDGDIPGSAEAAARLGWTLRAFTRRLDLVCAKLERQGVTGLRGATGRLATDRRRRLVEHAVATRLVTRDDLALLDGVP